MKKYIWILLVLFSCTINLKAQDLLKNGVEIFAGFGFTQSSHHGETFSLEYQREISKKLYLFIGHDKFQGSQTFTSLFGEVPSLDRVGEFGEIYEIRSEDLDKTIGRIIHQRSWFVGLKKFIQMSPKIFMGGGLAVNTNSISEMDVAGLVIGDGGDINYDNVYPVYSFYRSLGAKVSLEGLYFIRKNVALAGKAHYISSLSIVSVSLGTCITF